MAVKSLADIRALESVPFQDRNLPASTYAALQRCAEEQPDAPALSFFLNAARFKYISQWSYAELLSDITRVANTLHDLGIGPRDVVAVILPNLPETHFAIWGGEAAGIVMAINPQLDGAQLAELLRAANAKVVVTLAPTPGSDLWPKVAKQLPQLPKLRRVLWVSLSPYVPMVQRNTLRMIARKERPKHRNIAITELDSLMRHQPSDHLKSGRKIRAEDYSSYVCTGGTTGLPKIAVRTHGSEVFNAWALASSLHPRPRGQTIFCGMPLFHVNGQLVTGLMPWTRGDHVILGTPQGYRGGGLIARFWEMVEHFKINYFSSVPTVYSLLLEHPTSGHDISSLSFGLCGAAPMPVELFKAFEQTIGVRILEGYGLTEGACVSSCNPPGGERRIGSIGIRIAYQDMRIVILDELGHFLRNAEINEAGAIAIQGPNVFAGYLDPLHNEGMWIGIEGRSWLNTGDLGHQDADGYFWLTGRKKDLIIRGGHNIDPKQIEEALQGHPAVALVAAVGSPDSRAGEVPVAYVQLEPGKRISVAELMAFADNAIRERVAVPKRIEILESLPVTSVGKLFKPALQQREIAHVIQQEAFKAGVRDIAVEVVHDPQRGLVAQIRSEHQKAKLAPRLGRYAFQVDWLS